MKQVVLVGGGHSHLEVVRRFGERPPADAAILLIDPATHATYSGMVPGLIAGHYRFEDCHVDLARLCARARVTFLNRRVCRIDSARQSIQLDDGSSIAYDLASLDVGSTPAAVRTPGVAEHALMVKPFAGFEQRMNEVLDGVRKSRVRHIAVVGGGSAGVELALSLRHRIRQFTNETKVSFALITADDYLLRSHNPRVRTIVARLMNDRGITVHTNTKAEQLVAGSIICSGGTVISSDATIWATGPAAPAWFDGSGLALDARGFLSVDATLASVTDSNVFGAGDCATIQDRNYPKSGVYAVREGPVLAENIRRKLNGEPLLHYEPQHIALALISGGDRYAIASYGALALEGAWVWRWKDYIDRKFMRRYEA